ncbi:PAS domain-containing protein, partial [Staphylococcus aureus]|uniref:PAS domain-containing protein n=1 Tax=Staphylococcus aureus TaxID=1280 RepID=UPI001E5C695F
IRFRTLAESLPQMVWMMDADGRIEYFSKAWETYSGINDAVLAWEVMLHPDDREEITRAWHTCLSTAQSFRYEVRLK